MELEGKVGGLRKCAETETDMQKLLISASEGNT